MASIFRVSVDADGASRVNVVGSAMVAGRVKVSLSDDVKPGRYVIVSAAGGLDAGDISLEVPPSKIPWSIAVQGGSLVLKGSSVGLSIVVR